MKTHLARVKFVVRDATRLQPGRPALTMGLRTAIAVAAPMLVATRIGALAATWATLGGFSVVLVDKGGAYRTRAQAMATAALGGAAAVMVGTLAASTPAALAAIALGTAMCAMSATWAGPAMAVGNTIALQLIVATTLPHGVAHPWVPALGSLAGAAWSIVLALFLWPVRVYRPARLAAMRCLGEVSRHAADLAAGSGGEAARWRETALRRHRAIRDTLEAARAVLAATRRGRRAEIGRGERLLVIVEAVDQIFGLLIGVEEVLDHASAPARALAAGELGAGLAAAATRLAELADRVAIEEPVPALPALAWDAAAVRSRAAALAALARGEVEHAVALVSRIHEDLAAITAVVDSLAGERDPGALAPPTGASPGLRWTEALRASFAFDSVVLRHALRVGTVALLSVIATRALELQRGYWATLTSVLLLQPYLPATITRGVQRVVGTVAGGLLATAIAAVVHDPRGISLIAAALAATSAAVLQLNYALYALFMTPTFVLLAEVHAGDSHLVALRITNTLLGAGLALAGALLLWPSRESTRAGDRLSAALEAVAGYAHHVFAAVAAQAPARSAAVIAARRQVGRALNNADLSIDRLVAEVPAAAVLEPHMALATMTRRLSGTLSAFATARYVSDPGGASAMLTAIGHDAEAYLRSAARALRTGEPPPAYRRHDELDVALPSLLAARVARIDLQLSIIAEAVARTARVGQSSAAVAMNAT